MAILDFQNKTLERLYRSLKWARNNSIQLLDSAQEAEQLDWTPEGLGQNSILYQFQCLVTTTDTYIRRLSNNEDTQFGVLVQGGEMIRKGGLSVEQTKRLLKSQQQQLEELLQNLDEQQVEAKIRDIQSIANHEYLHQGQLVVMFKQASITIPERFKNAFDL